MKFIRASVIFLLLALITLACAGPTAESTPGVVLFSDDFSSADKGWGNADTASYTMDYYNSAYRIVINEADSDYWNTPQKQSFADVRVEVDTVKNGGPDDNIYGVICRFTDESHFYYAAISSDGYYGIIKMTEDAGFIIGEDNLLESGAIKHGPNTNRIRFDCVGSKLTLYVNGSKVAQQTDSDYSSGNVGLIAGTYETSGTDIVFDNFVVYQP